MWTEHDRQLVLKTKNDHPRWNWERIVKECQSKLDDDHSPSSCRKMYQRVEPDPARRMTPLPLWDRRNLAKMVYQEPRPSWEDIAMSLGYSVDECKTCYKYHLTENELDRGRREAMVAVVPRTVVVKAARSHSMAADTAPSSHDSPLTKKQNGKFKSEKSREPSPSPSSSKEKGVQNSVPSQKISNGIVSNKKSVSPSSSQASARYTEKWTTRDERNLLRYRARNMSWNEISEKLDRSIASCKSKYESLIEKSDEESDC